MSNTIHTKFGSCRMGNGYWIISSMVEGNRNKKLHRLIYEDYYKICLLPNCVIHHIDGDRLNNNISNLKAMTSSEHSSLHKKGKNNYWYGKHHTEKTKKKMSESSKNKRIPKEQRYAMSSKNGLPYHVYKQQGKYYKKGFTYNYKYYENGKFKKLCSVNLYKLHDKVVSKGLEWNWLNFDPNNLT